MNGKQLKNSILQWAIQGKLVPQDPNDEPASVLLERIREEKARLVKEKKIKKDKNESIIYRGDDNSYYEKFLATGEVKCIDEEIPFEIPEGWEWCRLGILFSHCTGKALNGINKKGKLYTYITTSNLYWDRFEISTLKEMFFTDEELDKCTATKGDLLVCEGGDIGRSAIWNYDYDIRIQNHIHKLRAYLPLCTRFFYYVMFLYKGIGNIGGKGIGIQGLSSGALHNIVLPLPSIQEQERIVAKIETIMPLAVKYEKSQNELNRLNDNIYTRLRKSILQEAIQGKLVPQDPNDEPASALLERICEEKQRLLKKGRLKKKEITESVIFKGEDNKYYEQIGSEVSEIETVMQFPDSWEIVRLGDICRLIDGEKRSGAFPCLDAKYLRGKSAATILQTGKLVQTGDNIILVDGENSGEVFSVPVDGYMGSTFKQLWISSELHLPYVLYFILFYKEQLRNSKKGAAIPHLNKEIFYNLLVGIPPLKEQQRLSESVNILFSKLS